VKEGGLLIASFPPGLTDQHGKPRAHGALDDVMGVTSKLGPVETGKDKLSPAAGGIWSGPATEVTVTALKGIQPGPESKVHARVGDVPALVTHKFGAGTAVLLNFTFSSWIDSWKGIGLADAPEPNKVRGVLQAALAQAPNVTARAFDGGLRPSAEALDPDGHPIRESEVLRFSNGPARYTGVIVTSFYGYNHPPRKCRVKFAEKSHLYDVRQGKYLGLADEAPGQLEVGSPLLFAQLPLRVEGLALAVSKQARPGEPAGVSVEIRMENKAATLPLDFVHIAVTGPDGKEVAGYAVNLKCRDGKGSTTIPLALNDPPGTWQVSARHVATGVAESATFQVKP
jgi:hypothetical protein